MVNSRGKERGDDGYFYMEYKDIYEFIDQIYAVYDSDDTDKMDSLLYKTKILNVINTLSDVWKYATEDEKQALNFANTMLRKVVFSQDHQYNMDKKQILDFINKYF